MSTEVVDGWAVKQLRELYRLDRTHVARLCGLTMGQVKQLEEGGYDSFGSPADKIQAAMRLAATLSGKQANGLPRANVFYIGNSPVLGNRYTARPGVSLKQERFIDSPKFLKSTLIAFVMQAFEDDELGVSIATMFCVAFRKQSQIDMRSLGGTKPSCLY